jgi:hypothetical protein
LSVPPRPVIRHCPLCGVAMQARKSRDELDKPDVFECLNCDTVISRAPPPPEKGDD